MTGRWRARLGTTALAVAAAALLASCGGGSGSSTSAPTAPASATTTQAGSKAPDGSRQKSKPPGKASSGSAPTNPKPLPNQGAKAAAPGVPISKDGDNSIQTYGVESKSAERVQAAATAEAYLRARARGNWSGACSNLTASVQAHLGVLGRHLKGSSKGCAGAMAALSSGVSKGTLRNAAAIHVLSLRVEGDRGFLIYRDGSGKPYNLPMQTDGGEWKVAGLIGSELVV